MPPGPGFGGGVDEVLAVALAQPVQGERRPGAVTQQTLYVARSDTTTAVTDLCAPVFDHSKGAVAALTMPYLRQRDVRVTVAAAREARLAATHRISAGLGARRHRPLRASET